MPPRFRREEHQRGSQHTRSQRRRGRDGDAEIGQRPLDAVLRDGRPPVSRERLIHGIEVERGEIDDGERLVFAGSMLALANETGHRVPAQRLRVAAHPPEQPTVGRGDDAAAHLRHRADRQLQLADRERQQLNVHPAFPREAGDSILGVLGERTTDERTPIVDPVNDQSASGHGHGRDRVANVGGDAAFEVELRVLQAPEQVPERVGGKPPRNVGKPGNSGHGRKITNS